MGEVVRHACIILDGTAFVETPASPRAMVWRQDNAGVPPWGVKFCQEIHRAAGNRVSCTPNRSIVPSADLVCKFPWHYLVLPNTTISPRHVSSNLDPG